MVALLELITRISASLVVWRLYMLELVYEFFDRQIKIIEEQVHASG